MDQDLFDLAKEPGNAVLPDALKLRPRPSAALSHHGHDEETSDKLGREEGIPKREESVGRGMEGGMPGNFIANIGQTERNFNKCIREHLLQNPDCDGLVVLDSKRYLKMGLGVRTGLKCNTCTYMSKTTLPFYEEVCKAKNAPGPAAAKLNIQLQVGLTKNPIGNSAIRNILATLDIDPPSERGMQNVANDVSDVYTNINQEQLSKNRDKIGMVMAIRNNEPLGNPVKIAVEADGGYNNPPKGRSFSQPATQSWMPMFCSEKGLELPVALATKSKLCSRCNMGFDCGKSCTRDFPLNTAMGSSEREMAKNCAEEVVKDGKLSIGAIVADGDSAIGNGIKEVCGDDIERQHCTRHLTKSVGRNIMKDDLKSVAGRTKALTKKNMLDLSRFVGKRCAWEFNAAHKKCGNDIEKLVILCRNLKEGVIACLDGDWKTCRRVSLVCQAHKRGGKGKKCWVSLKSG